jgi:hypothetical protein
MWSAGSYVLYVTQGDMAADLSVLSFDSGAVMHLGTLPFAALDARAPPVFVDPTKTRVAFVDASSALQLAVLDGSVPVKTLASTTDYYEKVAWSPDGAHFAFGYGGLGGSIAVVAADGSGRTNITDHSFWANSIVFSPDGALIAYDSYNTSTQEADVYIRRLSDGTNFYYAGVAGTGNGCGDWGYLLFSPNGKYIFAVNNIACLVTYSNLSWGIVGQDGFKGHLSDDWESFAFSRDGNFAAFPVNSDQTIYFVSVGGGGALPSPDPLLGPIYERVDPYRLLEANQMNKTLQVVNEDGTGTPFKLPGVPDDLSYYDSRWIGRRVLYGADAQFDVNRNWINSTLRVATDDGSVTGTLATFEVGWTAAKVDSPKHIFVVRNAAVAGADAGGLWSVTLP